MNKLAVLPLLFLTSCAWMDLQGHDPYEYFKNNPIENKVGPNGELISPDCPNWKMSPVTTFSNTTQANYGCAVTTNLGHMLEDPRDLAQGASGGQVSPNPDRSADAIAVYRIGISSPPPSAATTTPFTTGSGSAE